MCAAVVVPPTVVDRVTTDGLVLADFDSDSEQEIQSGSHSNRATRTAFWARRAAANLALGRAKTAEQDKIRIRIRTRLRSNAFRGLVRIATTPAPLPDDGAKYRPRGSIRPGRNRAVWKFRTDYGPATDKQLTYVIKTCGNQAGKRIDDLLDGGQSQRAAWGTNRIPVPRVLYGPVPNAGPPGAPAGQQFLVMEDVKGHIFNGMEGWNRRQKESFCMQLAAFMVQMLRTRSTRIGSFDAVIGFAGPVTVSGDCSFHRDRPVSGGGRSGEMIDHTQHENGRDAIRAAVPRVYNTGPYASAVSWVINSLSREIAFWTAYDPAPAEASGTGVTGAQRNLWLRRAAILRDYFRARHVEEADAPEASGKGENRPTGNYRLCHGNLNRGRNIMVRGAKIVAILDWDECSYLPLSEAMAGFNLNELSYMAELNRDAILNNVDYQLPRAGRNVSSGFYDYMEGPGSDYESDRGADGVRMYEDSDGGDYNTDDELKEVNARNEQAGTGARRVPPFDWWEDYITPRVSVYVYNWLHERVALCVAGEGIPHANPVQDMEMLAARNSLLKHYAREQMDPLTPFPRATEVELRMLFREYPPAPTPVVEID